MMNILRLTLAAAAVSALATCATTPEQQAQRAAAQKHYEQNLQVALAAQCDRETAQLMREQFQRAEQGPLSEQDKAFRLKYVDKIADPMFQACYKMAWQNHISQQRLRDMRYYYDDWDDFYYPFRRHPLWW